MVETEALEYANRWYAQQIPSCVSVQVVDRNDLLNHHLVSVELKSDLGIVARTGLLKLLVQDVAQVLVPLSSSPLRSVRRGIWRRGNPGPGRPLMEHGTLPSS